MGDIADWIMEGWDADDIDEEIDIEQYWKTKDGRVLLISAMTDEHLKNTIAFLDRRGAGAQLRREDGARDAVTLAEAAMSVLQEDMLLRYENMLEEQERRRKNAKPPDAVGADPHARRTNQGG